MMTNNNIRHLSPVLSSSDIERDIKWYEAHTGFTLYYQEHGYAVLQREDQWVHLQWHHDNDEDPVYGSVLKIFVNDIHAILDEMVERGSVNKEKLRLNTPWNTHEFGFYDLNKNAIYFVADID